MRAGRFSIVQLLGSHVGSSFSPIFGLAVTAKRQHRSLYSRTLVSAVFFSNFFLFPGLRVPSILLLTILSNMRLQLPVFF